MKRGDLSVKECIVIGFAIALLQLIFVFAVTGHDGMKSLLSNLIRWDTRWYSDIAEYGYHSIPKEEFPEGLSANSKFRSLSNVAFFPGYPIFGRVLAKAGGLHINTALFLAAQLTRVGMWIYLFLLFRRWRIAHSVIITASLLIFYYPSAYYLVVPYSESLFLMMLLGYIYWSGEKGRVSTILAVLHGFLMTATRLVGLPVALYPFIRTWFGSDKKEKSAAQSGRPFLLFIAAAAGALAFFVYCQIRFGEWDLYLINEKRGWNLTPDLFFLLHSPLKALFPAYEISFITFVNRLSAAVAFWFLFGSLILEVVHARMSGSSSWRERLPLHFVAWGLYFIPAAGFFSRNMLSMFRHVLPPIIVMILTLAHLFSRWDLKYPRILRFVVQGALLLILAAFVLAQAMFVYQYTRGTWIA